MRLNPIAAGVVFAVALLWPPVLGIVLVLWFCVYVALSLLEDRLDRRAGRDPSEWWRWR